MHAKLIPDPITGATKNFIDIVSIEERPNKFLFTVESSGGLAARDIVMQVCGGCCFALSAQRLCWHHDPLHTRHRNHVAHHRAGGGDMRQKVPDGKRGPAEAAAAMIL